MWWRENQTNPTISILGTALPGVGFIRSAGFLPQSPPLLRDPPASWIFLGWESTTRPCSSKAGPVLPGLTGPGYKWEPIRRVQEPPQDRAGGWMWSPAEQVGIACS